MNFFVINGFYLCTKVSVAVRIKKKMRVRKKYLLSSFFCLASSEKEKRPWIITLFF